jgi:glycerol-3-phosphate dehydrogenase
VTVTGGKLTTYRRMAADTVDAVGDVLGRRTRCRTKKLTLVGGEGYAPSADDAAAEHLGRRYGTGADAVRALVADDPTLGEPLVPNLPYLRAEAVYAVREEMARTLDDVLSRRTRARLLRRDDSARVADDVARLMQAELAWSDVERTRQVDEYRASVQTERASAALPETALDAALGT